MIKVNILGTQYKIVQRTAQEDSKLYKIDAYCDYTSKTIVYIKHSIEDIMDMGLDNLQYAVKRILRHEIVHAFLYESGLWANTPASDNWSLNEEMVDWIAIQSPKLFEVFKKLELL